MRNGVDFIPAENVVHERRVADIADNEFRRVLDCHAVPCRKIIENDNVFAGIEEGQHHMAADITCPASYKNRHAVTRTRNRLASATWCKATFLSLYKRFGLMARSLLAPCQQCPSLWVRLARS